MREQRRQTSIVYLLSRLCSSPNPLILAFPLQISSPDILDANTAVSSQRGPAKGTGGGVRQRGRGGRTGLGRRIGRGSGQGNGRGQGAWVGHTTRIPVIHDRTI